MNQDARHNWKQQSTWALLLRLGTIVTWGTDWSGWVSAWSRISVRVRIETLQTVTLIINQQEDKDLRTARSTGFHHQEEWRINHETARSTGFHHQEEWRLDDETARSTGGNSIYLKETFLVIIRDKDRELYSHIINILDTEYRLNYQIIFWLTVTMKMDILTI